LKTSIVVCGTGIGGVATALAVGSYLEPFVNADPAWNKAVVAGASLSVVGVFHWLQCRGVREQSSWLNAMTLAAVASTAADVRGELKNGGNVAAAKKVGKAIAEFLAL
jgi:hypothetical protein